MQGLLAVPFVLGAQPTAAIANGCANGLTNGHTNGHTNGDLNRYSDDDASNDTARRYAEVMSDVERLINDHIEATTTNPLAPTKLSLLVPTIGSFFTPLALRSAFLHQDEWRSISRRRFVPPSFNDIRVILNTAQLMAHAYEKTLELVTFDGDVTLYDDGFSLVPDNPVISRILRMMKRDMRVGIVTAAGYTEAEKYAERLHGLLEAVHSSTDLTDEQRGNLIVMGGESSYLFRYNPEPKCRLAVVPREEWEVEEMQQWTDDTIKELLDLAQKTLEESIASLRLRATVIRKDRAVGIIPSKPGLKIPREALEDTVLVVQHTLENSEAGKKLPFCAFNGGNDVFVDIGDKKWGALVCQRFFTKLKQAKTPGAAIINGAQTLHVGDQFLSAGANDFKARMACTTAWITSPAETVALLDELEAFHDAARGLPFHRRNS